MPDRIETILLRTRGELASLAPQWHALWRHDPNATPFQSPEWLLPWVRQFGRRDLCSVAICQNGRLIGLLPLYIYKDRQRCEAQLLLLGAGTSDYLDGIFAPTCSPEHIREALKLLRSAGDWEVAYLTQLHSNSKLLTALRGSGATPVSSQSCARRPAASISDLPPKIRQNARYYRNCAERRGVLKLGAAEVTDCLAWFESLHKLHSERWQRSGQSGALADPRVLAWHREAVPLLAYSGVLRPWTLTLNSEPIAALYALADPPGRLHRSLYIYLPAFSVGHADLRPGTLLLAMAIEHAAAEGVHAIDFLRGDEAYKHFWHAQSVPTFGFSIRSAEEIAAAA